MAAGRNYYEILGLPRNATNEQIKKRYRQLARKYHPDVTDDKAFGQKAFVEITEAYKTLVDTNKRASYDLTLPQHAAASRTPGTTGASGSTSGQAARRTARPAVTVDSLLRDAQFSFVKGRLNEATNLCRQALKINQTDPRAHAMMGDIYAARQKLDHAVIEYTYAMQYNPSDTDTQRKLEKMTGRNYTPKKQEHKETIRHTAVSGTTKHNAVVGAIGWPMAFAVLLIFSLLPSEPVSSLRYYLPLIDKWNWSIVTALFVSSLIAGAVMMLTGVVRNPDEELGLKESGILPIGILLLLFSVVFFWGASAIYLLLGALQGRLSKSVVKVLGVAAAIVLFAGFLYHTGSDQVWLLGGNVAFAGILTGWYGAAMSRPLSG